MADKPLRELRSLYRQIETSEVEMARYRRRLAGRLTTPRTRWWPVLAAALAAAAAIIAVLLPPATEHDLSGLQLAELQSLAAVPPAALVDRAREQVLQEQSPERWNASMLLCLIESREQAVQLAAQGVQGDPRPEFRFRYLEILLDQADEYQYSEERIVELMDREDDKGCLRLYRRLLHLAT